MIQGISRERWIELAKITGRPIVELQSMSIPALLALYVQCRPAGKSERDAYHEARHALAEQESERKRFIRHQVMFLLGVFPCPPEPIPCPDPAVVETVYKSRDREAL